MFFTFKFQVSLLPYSNKLKYEFDKCGRVLTPDPIFDRNLTGEVASHAIYLRSQEEFETLSLPFAHLCNQLFLELSLYQNLHVNL